MPNPYRLFLDRRAGKLLRSPDAYQLTSLQEAINAGDDSQIPIELIPLDALDGGGYEVASYATDDVRLAIGNTSEQPTAGTFVIDHDTYTSEVFYVESLTTDSLERGLNGITSIYAAGGVQVIEDGKGWIMQTIQNGILGAITADEQSLAPHGTVKIVEISPGTATTKSSYKISLVADPYALLTSWEALDAAAVAISTITPGASTIAETQQIAITGAVSGGYFTVTDGTTVSASLAHDASASQVEDAINGVLGASTVTVTKPNSCCWHVRWAAVGNQDILTVTGALTSWTGLAGTIELNTVSLASSIAGQGRIPATAQIIETLTSADEKHVYQEELELSETIISNATLTTIATGLLPDLKASAVFTSATRAAEIPDYIGQVGAETDTGLIYTATGTSAGNWRKDSVESFTVTNEAELSTAIAFSGSADSVVRIADSFTLTGNHTLPSNVSLKFLPGCIIDAGGNVLTIDGPIIADRRQLFTNAPARSVVGKMGGAPRFPEWWGAVINDDTADDYVALDAAIKSGGVNVGDGFPLVSLGQGGYSVSQGLDTRGNKHKLFGIGNLGSNIKAISPFLPVVVDGLDFLYVIGTETGETTWTRGFQYQLEDFMLDCANIVDLNGISGGTVSVAEYSYMRLVRVKQFYLYGLHLDCFTNGFNVIGCDFANLFTEDANVNLSASIYIGTDANGVRIEDGTINPNARQKYGIWNRGKNTTITSVHLEDSKVGIYCNNSGATVITNLNYSTESDNYTTVFDNAGIDAVTGVITEVGHRQLDGDMVLVSAGTAVQPELTVGTAYHVVGVAGDTYQLSETRGGAAITFTPGVYNVSLVKLCIPIQVNTSSGQVTVMGVTVDTDPTRDAVRNILQDLNTGLLSEDELSGAGTFRRTLGFYTRGEAQNNYERVSTYGDTKLTGAFNGFLAGKFNIGSVQDIQIVSGAVTVDDEKTLVRLESQSGPTDSVSQMFGHSEGDIVIVTSLSGSTITLVHDAAGAGANGFRLQGDVDRIIESTEFMVLLYFASRWREISFSGV